MVPTRDWERKEKSESRTQSVYGLGGKRQRAVVAIAASRLAVFRSQQEGVGEGEMGRGGGGTPTVARGWKLTTSRALSIYLIPSGTFSSTPRNSSPLFNISSVSFFVHPSATTFRNRGIFISPRYLLQVCRPRSSTARNEKESEEVKGACEISPQRRWNI